jgi:CubicO group peptidase (beta-lactamase class C family)
LVCLLFALLPFQAGCDRPPENPEAVVQFEPTIVEEHNFSRSELRRFERAAHGRSTRALLLLQHDRILVESYSGGYDSSRRHHTASLAKSLLGGLGLALALDRGWLTLETTVAEFYPAWREDPLRREITVGQLASHSSGLQDAEQEGLSHSELTGWRGEFWKRSPNPILTSLRDAEIGFTPGERFGYSNPGYAVLGYTLSAAAARAGEPNLVAALERELWEPLGIPAAAHSSGYGQSFNVDGVDVPPNWGGAAFTARALARIGQLIAHDGRIDGLQLLSAASIRATVRPAPTPREERPGPNPQPTYGWYTNSNRSFPQLPDDAIFGAGAGQQLLLIIPSQGVVVARFGNSYDDSADSFWQAVEPGLAEPLARLMRRPLIAASPFFSTLRFAPLDEVACSAESSDNWPISWADDDLQYTSYGDGWGFEPKLADKLSLGLATIEGPVDNYLGTNLRSDGERLGDGRAGAKASGLLALDDRLYMWVRNLANAELWSSADGGTSWLSAFRWDRSFGSPTFLQFGQNYAGGSEWVYSYSQDGASAYESNDAVVLARVRRDELLDPTRWEFYSGRNDDGTPRFSPEIAQRQPVVRYPDGCARVDVAYHPASSRYLMALGNDLTGGWSLLDAPEPWGPWTVVWQTPDWGLGATHGYRLPTKWMSTDEDRLTLIFSGRPFRGRSYDGFCLLPFEVERRSDPIN